MFGSTAKEQIVEFSKDEYSKGPYEVKIYIDEKVIGKLQKIFSGYELKIEKKRSCC